jgi:hypothetical protein
MRQCLPVAVVVTAHNAAGFLDETLECAWAQTTPPGGCQHRSGGWLECSDTTLLLG